MMSYFRAVIFIICLSILSPAMPASGDTDTGNSRDNINFTAQEKLWLSQKHRIRARVAFWPPYQFWENGPKGIAVDILKSIAEKYGLDIEFYKAQYSWADTLANIRDHFQVDLILTIKATPDRAHFIAFTENYLSMPWVIFTRKDSIFVSGINDLIGKTVAIQRGFVMHELLRKDYPGIKLQVVDDTLEAIRSVGVGEADAFIGNLAVGTYIIQHNGITNVKVAAPTPFENHSQAMGIRNDWPELASIISKGLSAMSQEEKTAIRSKWISVRYEHGISWTDIILWGGLSGTALLLIIGFIGYSNKQLHEAGKRLTEEISRRKAAQDQLQELLGVAQVANKAKNTFIATMSHEIRTPLNGVLGMLNLLEMTDLNKEQSEFVAVGQTSGKNLLNILNDILDISRIESGKIELRKEPCSISEIVQETCITFAFKAKEKGLTISHHISEEVPDKVILDCGRLRQILFNLVGNAIKFTNEGSVKVSVISEESPDPDKVNIIFTISDTGIGIPAGQHRHIFDSFTQADDSYTREYNGTGLGLSIVKRLVDLMGGRIELMSAVDQGTNFRIILSSPTAEKDKDEND